MDKKKGQESIEKALQIACKEINKEIKPLGWRLTMMCMVDTKTGRMIPVEIVTK